VVNEAVLGQISLLAYRFHSTRQLLPTSALIHLVIRNLRASSSWTCIKVFQIPEPFSRSLKYDKYSYLHAGVTVVTLAMNTITITEPISIKFGTFHAH
jgi:hypothetical protein